MTRAVPVCVVPQASVVAQPAVVAQAFGSAISLLLLLLSSVPSFAQTQTTPARDVRVATGGSGILSGKVITDGPGARPVRNARVTCTGPSLSTGLTTVTDDDGRFAFASLAAGHYSVTATKAAWLTGAYGAKRPFLPGTPVALRDGQHLGITVKLLQGSVITGTVLDQNGRAPDTTRIVAFRSAVKNGVRQLQDVGRADTDDRGVYRIYGLAPGDYIVGARPPASFASATGDVRLADKAVTVASTYFPGTTLPAQAVRINVGRAQERDGIDFMLQLVSTAHVDGMVSMSDGSPVPRGAQLHLLLDSSQGFPGAASDGVRSAAVTAESTFSFARVAPGQYTVLGRATAADGSIVSGATSIGVDGDAVEGLAVTLEPGVSVRGRIIVDRRASSSPPPADSLRLNLFPTDPASVGFTPGAVTVARDGSFAFPSVPPGRYRLVPAVRDGDVQRGWMVKSATVAGRDALETPFTVTRGQNVTDATIALSDVSGRVSGTAVNAAGRPAIGYTVLIFPVDPQLWVARSPRIRGGRATTDGEYAIAGLPRGDYLLAVADDVGPDEWSDPTTLQRLAATATRLTLGDGQQKTLDVRTGGSAQR